MFYFVFAIWGITWKSDYIDVNFQKVILGSELILCNYLKGLYGRTDVWNYISKYGSPLDKAIHISWNEPIAFLMHTTVLIIHREVHRQYLENTIIIITLQLKFSHLFLITCYHLSICSHLSWCHKVSQLQESPSVDTILQPLRVFPEAHCEDSVASFSASTHTNLNRYAAQLGADLTAHREDAKASSASKTATESQPAE